MEVAMALLLLPHANCSGKECLWLSLAVAIPLAVTVRPPSFEDGRARFSKVSC